MSRLLDLTGKKFGRLLVISRAVSRKGRDTRWKCKCDCGRVTFARSWSLRKAMTTSCGCFASELKFKHGRSPKKLYAVWHHMKDRCYNSNNARYPRYGGCGITVCNEWLNDFSAFRSWAFSAGYSEGLTIERIDNDASYSPSNCRWATNLEQQNNKSNSRIITAHGESHTIAEWSRILGIDPRTLHHRFARGKSPEEIVQPVYGHLSPKTFFR